MIFPLKFAYGGLTCKDPEHCIADKNNWDTNYVGSALGYWLNDTSGDAVDIYVHNDNLLHNRHGHPPFVSRRLLYLKKFT